MEQYEKLEDMLVEAELIKAPRVLIQLGILEGSAANTDHGIGILTSAVQRVIIPDPGFIHVHVHEAVLANDEDRKAFTAACEAAKNELLKTLHDKVPQMRIYYGTIAK